MRMTNIGRYNRVSTAWRRSGSGRDVILLHGWGQNMQMMSAIEDHLKDRFSVYNLDFPGFGESDMPPEPWGVPDYVKFLRDFVEQNGIECPILIGHSFGCRVAIRYAALYPVRKMCLTGAAGIKPPHSAGYQARNRILKAGKWLLKVTGNEDRMLELQRNVGSEDYQNTTGVMKPTFIKVVEDDVSPILKDVKCPVLLVWGDRDTAAPLWMGKKMEQEMPNAGLAIFEGDDHWAYWHQQDRFNRVLDVFLKEDGKR